MLKEIQNQNAEHEFFHVSDSVDFLKSFMNEGVRTIGKGQGGQTDGFYVFENKSAADSHVRSKIDSETLSLKGGLIIGVKARDITYPDWQFDFEGAPDAADLFHKYVTDVCALKHFPVIYNNNPEIISVRQETRPGSFQFQFDGSHTLSTQRPGDCAAAYSGIFQAICDHLCATNPDFIKDYNVALLHSHHSAKKYTGSQKLPISYISLVQPTSDGKFTEKVLYTDSKPKTEQMCPFLTAHMAQKHPIK